MDLTKNVLYCFLDVTHACKCVEWLDFILILNWALIQQPSKTLRGAIFCLRKCFTASWIAHFLLLSASFPSLCTFPVTLHHDSRCQPFLHLMGWNPPLTNLLSLSCRLALMPTTEMTYGLNCKGFLSSWNTAGNRVRCEDHILILKLTIHQLLNQVKIIIPVRSQKSKDGGRFV